ncbi:MAG: hypothetical protein L3J15_08470 [Devosiaceae bacterium]|nr:hypothetical protein [Devosiaceae bacterium]
MTVLKPKIIKRVKDEKDQLIREKITPWLMGFSSGKLEIENFHGRIISYSGIEFSGSPCDVFWGCYIEPFLENITNQLILEIAKECKESKLDIRAELDFLTQQLNGLYNAIYKEMSETEQRLLGKGFPDKIQKRDVNSQITTMKKYLEQHVEMEIQKHTSAIQKSSKSIVSRLWQDPVWSKVIATGILALLSGIYFFWKNDFILKSYDYLKTLLG